MKAILPALLLAACASAPVGEVPVSVAQPEFSVGDQWIYLVRDGYNGEVLRTYSEKIIAITEDQVRMRSSGPPLDTGSTETYRPDGNPIDILTPRAATAVRYTAYYPAYIFPLEVGNSWQQDVVIGSANSKNIRAVLHGKMVGWEHVVVPAGQFDALKIRREIYLDDEEFWRWGTVASHVDWYVPGIHRFVRQEEHSEYIEKSGRYPNNIRRGDWTITELLGYAGAATKGAATKP